MDIKSGAKSHAEKGMWVQFLINEMWSLDLVGSNEIYWNWYLYDFILVEVLWKFDVLTEYYGLQRCLRVNRGCDQYKKNDISVSINQKWRGYLISIVYYNHDFHTIIWLKRSQVRSKIIQINCKSAKLLLPGNRVLLVMAIVGDQYALHVECVTAFRLTSSTITPIITLIITISMVVWQSYYFRKLLIFLKSHLIAP